MPARRGRPIVFRQQSCVTFSPMIVGSLRMLDAYAVCVSREVELDIKRAVHHARHSKLLQLAAAYLSRRMVAWRLCPDMII